MRPLITATPARPDTKLQACSSSTGCGPTWGYAAAHRRPMDPFTGAGTTTGVRP